MTEYKFKLTEPQKRFYDSTERQRLYIGGRGAGKSYVLVVDLITYVAKHQNSTVLVIGTTHNTVRNVIIKMFNDICPGELVMDYNRSTSEIKLINGANILFRSGNSVRDIDNLRGLSVNSVYIDEICTLSKYLYDVVLPMVRNGDDENQHINMFGTPKIGWVYDKFKVKKSTNTFIIDEINSDSNTYLGDGFLQSLIDEFIGTPWYDAEIAGKWVRQSGLVYNINPVDHDELPGSYQEYAYSIDFGFSAPASILTYGSSNGKWYIIDEVYETHMTDEMVANQMKVLYQQYGKGKCVCDSAQPQSIQYLKDRGIKAFGADKGVDVGVRTVRNLLDNGILTVSSKCLNLIYEGNNFIYAKEDNDDKFEGTRHSLDSCRYFCMSIYKARKTRTHRIY